MNIYPNKYINKVEKIEIEDLKKEKIEVLILDVDNTLIDLNKKVSDSIIKWSENIKQQGIKLYILSNSNNKEKVESVANKLEIEYEMFAKKPLKVGFLKIQKKLNIENSKIGVVGDQIFTDVIGGNRCNMYTILVDPIDKKEYWYTAWKRPIEEYIKRKFLKKQNNKTNEKR